MIFPKVLLTSAFVFLPFAAYAVPDCAPVFDDAVLNISYECLNDATAMIVDSSNADGSGWQYSPDSFLDGLTGAGVGGGTYEMYGIALRETQTEIWIALNGNVPIGGVASGSADDGIISWGDLFINFTGNNFLTASNAQALYAIRFSATNNSGAALLGLYSAVAAKSVVSTNHGIANYGAYENYVIVRGSIPDLGIFDTGAAQTYYSTAISLNVIHQSDWLGSIEFLSAAQLTDSGFNPAVFGGLYTVAFRFNKRLIIDECGVPGGDGTSCLDCAGVACGGKVFDDCGVCGGNNTTCLDCAGVVNGTALVDQCGVCEGNGTSCLDCSGTVNGSAVFDQCGICGGDGTSCLDCAGTVHGSAVFDRCGICAGDSTSCLDCAGTPNGLAVWDRCGVCAGDGSSCLGCVEKTETERYDASRALLKKQLESIILGLKTSQYSRAFKLKVLRMARKAYREAVTSISTLPPVVNKCENAQFCISLDTGSESIRQIKARSLIMVRLNQTIYRSTMRNLQRGRCGGTAAKCLPQPRPSGLSVKAVADETPESCIDCVKALADCRQRVLARNALLRKTLRDAQKHYKNLKKTVSSIEVFTSQCQVE